MPEYILGRSEQESQRLITQANMLQPLTEQILAGAGIQKGMNVLDLGCGAGDVSFILAKLTGSSGSVTGIDCDPAILSHARNRAEKEGLQNVTFLESTLESFKADTLFDAVVGRFVLLYQADPIKTLAHASSQVRNGGIIVSMETDMSVGLESSPSVPLWNQTGRWIVDSFRQAGIHVDMGAKLFPTFIEAGLPGPKLRYFRAAGGGKSMRPLYGHYCDMIRSILPRMEQLGVATLKDIQIDTLPQRLEEAITLQKAQVYSMPMLSAWTSKP